MKAVRRLDGRQLGWQAALLLMLAIPAAQAAPAKRVGPKTRKPAARTKAKAPARKPAPKPAAEPRIDDHPQIAALNQPFENGPGVLVCEPVSANADPETGDFGAGCGRWLHLVVGGQGQFGRTPLWTWTDRVRIELKKKDLRLTLGDALLAAKKLALTHVAVGEMTGSAEKCTLTYRLVEVAGKKPLGEPIVLAGTTAELTAGLGGAARQLIQRLGVADPRLPAGPGETPAELAIVGRLPRVPDDRIPLAQVRELRQLASLSPGQPAAESRPVRPVMGAFLASILFSNADDLGLVTRCARLMSQELPENTLVLGELTRNAYFGTIRSRSVLEVQRLPSLIEKYPRNLALRIADTYLTRLPGGNLDQARKSAEVAIRCATRLPDTWLVLEGVIGQQAQAIRRGRFVTDMTEEELNRCTALYAQQLPLCLKAVELSPDSDNGWNSLSGTAAFLGESELADGACERALQLAPRSYRVLSWAVQLYQPKWIDDRNKLTRAGRMAVQAADELTSEQRLRLAVALHHADLPDLGRQVLRTDPERQEYDDHLKSHQ